MSNGTKYSHRDIVMIPWPYSDLTATAQRPALIVSNHAHNGANDDFIFCALTSNAREWVNSVEVANSDLESGQLVCKSRIKPTKLMALHKGIIKFRVATLNKQKCQEVVNAINDILKL
jgi:mRNA interferase MazF